MPPVGDILLCHVIAARNVLLALFACVALCRGGTTAPSFIASIWGKEAGLPSASVAVISQTHDGYLWVGTSAGLARFDGQRFQVWNRLNTPSFKNDSIRCLAEDSEGNLWVGTWEGLVRINGSSVSRLSGFEQFDERQPVGCLSSCRTGGVWIGGRLGLFRYLNGSLTLFGEPAHWRPEGVRALYEDDEGVLWMGTNDGLCRLAPGAREFKAVARPESVPDWPVVSIQGDGAGGLWLIFCRADEGLLCHFNAGVWRVVGRPLDFDMHSVFVTRSRGGDLWLPLQPGALHRFRDGEFIRVPLPETLDRSHIQNVFEDRDGCLWIGMQEDGLVRWQPRGVQQISVADGLVHSNAWAICESRDGSMWVGTDQGLSRIVGGKVTNFTTKDGLPHKVVRALAEDRSGRLWVGTGSGLACLQEGKIVHHRFPGDWANSKVRAILIDQTGTFWIGTAKGLHRFVPKAGRAGILDDDGLDPSITGDITTYRTEQGLPDNDISALIEGPDGDVWIGTSDGLCRFRNETFSHLSFPEGVPRGNVGVLLKDQSATVWVGTERTLLRWRDGRWKSFGVHEGLPDDVINGVIRDDVGDLWISGDRGVLRVPVRQLEELETGRRPRLAPVIYTRADGLPSEETNGQKAQPSSFRTADGRLWFPTTTGVAVFDPRRLPDLTNPPPVNIERVIASGRTVFANHQLDSVQPVRVVESDPASGELALPPGSAEILEFQYTGVGFVEPDRMQFKYRLAGQDADWVEAGPRRSAFYTNLRPGEYRFQVIAAGRHGIWNEQGAAFAFRISPHYYQTIVFKFSCVLAGGSLLWGVYRGRLGSLRRRQELEKQAALEAERARLARDLHDGLGASLSRIALLADLAGDDNPANNSRNRALATASRDAVRSLKDTLWVIDPKDSSIEGLASRIGHDAEAYLRPAGIRCRLDLQGDLPRRIVRASARQDLMFSAKEALHNVIKHSGAVTVDVRVTVVREVLQIVIRDDGRGLPADRNPLSGVTEQNADAGRGLRNMHTRMLGLGANCLVSGAPEGGTEVHFEVPLSKICDP